MYHPCSTPFFTWRLPNGTALHVGVHELLYRELVALLDSTAKSLEFLEQHLAKVWIRARRRATTYYSNISSVPVKVPHDQPCKLGSGFADIDAKATVPRYQGDTGTSCLDATLASAWRTQACTLFSMQRLPCMGFSQPGTHLPYALMCAPQALTYARRCRHTTRHAASTADSSWATRQWMDTGAACLCWMCQMRSHSVAWCVLAIVTVCLPACLMPACPLYVYGTLSMVCSARCQVMSCVAWCGVCARSPSQSAA